MTENELYHHGVKNMKWGVRRYQNPDGTLTELGKRRLESTKKENRPTSQEGVNGWVHNQVAEDYGTAKSALGSVRDVSSSANSMARRRAEKQRQKMKDEMDVSSMSDKELQQVINRMNLEQSYKRLKTQDVKTGSDYASDILSTVGEVVGIAGGVAGIMVAIHTLKHGEDAGMENELYHHGIKGQKWGVRRYQNYNGSYTQKGLARYRDKEAKYGRADRLYKETKRLYKAQQKGNDLIDPKSGKNIRIDKNVVKEAAQEKRAAKRKMSMQYKQLKRDYRADKGKELYRSGKTISGEQVKASLGIIAAGYGGAALANRFLNADKQGLAAATLVASSATEIALAANYVNRAGKLRAYYGHTGHDYD